MEKSFDVIVVGSGPAGLTAAIYSTRSNLNTLVVAGAEAGGQLMLTTDVDDFPGFPQGIQGPELMGRMRQQAERLGAKVINEDVTKVELSERPFKIVAGSSEYKAGSLIIATGASAKWLGLESEQKLIGRGVSACAVCDGPFFKGKKVAVVGGGAAAIREALFLAKLASHVYVVHRRDQLRAFQALQDRAHAVKNIEFVWNSVVNEVLGENKVEGVQIKDVKSEKSKKLELNGLFIAIGHKPNTDFLKGQLDLDKKGYIVVKDKSKTSVPGVFAAGDVHDYRYQQAVTAAGAGCMAAMDAEEFLEDEKSKSPQKAKK
jgi:thioredoxin reductase (NADPH)